MAFVKSFVMLRVKLLRLQAGVAASVRRWLLAGHSLKSGMHFGVNWCGGVMFYTEYLWELISI